MKTTLEDSCGTKAISKVSGEGTDDSIDRSPQALSEDASPRPAAGDGGHLLSKAVCSHGLPWPVWLIVFAVVLCGSFSILQVGEVLTLFWLGALVNVALSILKMGLAQIATHGKALMADALHGLVDTMAEVVTALAYTEAARPPDKEHPWGHGKIESIGTLLVTCVLIYVAATMMWESVTALLPLAVRWLRGQAHEAPEQEDDKAAEEAQSSSPRSAGQSRVTRHFAIAVTLTSILLKEALFTATLTVGERANSNLIIATAWHHRSDSLAAAVALASQLGAAVGVAHYVDPLGSGIVATMLAHSAYGNLLDSVNELIDYDAASDVDGGTERTRCRRDLLSGTHDCNAEYRSSSTFACVGGSR
eukprot:TRINITY_DN29825_c0_g1_i3.p1 TRINITY_DN29825_c0_g1~~TRINITY_DN29825_c0_g1_i3.p1  ORF type:complete len:362 (-),score=48.14 TRINITY_DN29825_c0_g1_i3:67-1152(-)